jgi:hypothetical protein
VNKMPKNNIDTISDWLKQNVLTEDTLKLETNKRDPENAKISIEIDWDDVADSLYTNVIEDLLKVAKDEGIEQGREEST